MLEAAALCLAMNMYHEARGDGELGMMAVAEVTLNRVEDPRYPDNVCDVVYQGYRYDSRACQFSWYCDGESDEMRDGELASLAYELAVDYLTGLETNITDGATHYHASRVSPYWAPTKTYVTTVHSHLFYRWD